MSKFFARFRKDEKGATAIEYGLIAALISVGIIGAATLVGGSVETAFQTVADELQDAVGGGEGGEGGEGGGQG